jgi:hypothetical protein
MSDEQRPPFPPPQPQQPFPPPQPQSPPQFQPPPYQQAPPYQQPPPNPYGQPMYPVPAGIHGPPNPKEKTPAILLAVFLGFWTWVYTWRRDQWKFWTNLGLTVLTLGFWGVVAWIWAIVDVCVKPDDWYRNFPNG